MKSNKQRTNKHVCVCARGGKERKERKRDSLCCFNLRLELDNCSQQQTLIRVVMGFLCFHSFSFVSAPSMPNSSLVVFYFVFSSPAYTAILFNSLTLSHSVHATDVILLLFRLCIWV